MQFLIPEFFLKSLLKVGRKLGVDEPTPERLRTRPKTRSEGTVKLSWGLHLAIPLSVIKTSDR